MSRRRIFATTTRLYGCMGIFSATPNCQKTLSNARSDGTLTITTAQPSPRLIRQNSDLKLAIVAEISNRTRETLFVQQCEGFHSALTALQTQVGETWQLAFQPNCEFRLRPPIALPPNSVHSDTAVIPWEVHRPAVLSMNDTGRIYRALYLIRHAPSGQAGTETLLGPLVAEAQRFSNSFRVRE